MKSSSVLRNTHKQELPSSLDVNSADSTRGHIPFKLAIALLLFTFLLFANTINQYFLLDDFEVLYSAKYNTLPHVLMGYDTVLELKFFRPAPMFFTWLLYHIFGLAPAVFHIASVLLHALTAIAAANLVYIFHKKLLPAAALGFFFIAFPNHAEVVNWPAITFTSWAALFYLLSLNFFAYYRLSAQSRFLLLSLVCFLLGMLSKEDAFTLPAVLVVFDFCFSRMRRLEYRPLRQVPLYILYFLLLAAVIMVTRVNMKLGAGYLTVQGEDLVSIYLKNVWALIPDLSRMNLRAWKYLLAPISPEIPFSKYLIFLAIFLILFSLVVLIWKKQLNPLSLIFSFLFVSITTLPTLGTFRVLALTHWIRFLYLPSFGGCYIISLILSGILNSTKKPAGHLAVWAIMMAPIIALTKHYDHQWIIAQQENKQVLEEVTDRLGKLPVYSRVYVDGIPWSRNEIPRIDYSFPGALGLLFDRNQLQGGLNFLPANKVLALDREESVEENFWRYFYSSLDQKTGKLTAPLEITPKTVGASFEEGWDFAEMDDQRFLAPVNEMVLLRPNNSFSWPLFGIDGSWTLLWLPMPDPNRPVKYIKVDLMMMGESVGPDICRIFWISEDDPEISGGKSIGFFAQTDGNFHEYTIPLYRNGLTLIHPRLMRFAIRPSQKRGTVFSLRKMSVGYY
jgi:hypothetical protein